MSTNIRITRICEFCKKEFTAKTTKTRYCSHICNRRGYKELAKQVKIATSNKQTELIKNTDLEKIRIQEFLNINQVSQLFGISRRTVYRMISRGELDIAKFGTRTVLRRCDLDAFFSLPTTFETEKSIQKFPGIENCYTITQIQQKVNISSGALYTLIQRQGIAKYSIGKYTYVAKNDIDIIFNITEYGEE